MAETIKWNFITQVVQGPKLSGAGEVGDVDAYDKFTITLAADQTSQEVKLVPDSTISLLVINPTPAHADLSYERGNSRVALDGPHVLIGAGAVSLLDGATSLTFTNSTGADAVIEILVGRDSTPTP